jgi:hypothetical protein
MTKRGCRGGLARVGGVVAEKPHPITIPSGSQQPTRKACVSMLRHKGPSPFHQGSDMRRIVDRSRPAVFVMSLPVALA